jgi:hypothetical protein
MAATPFTYPSVRLYNKGMKKTEHILVISGRRKRKRGAETKRAKRAFRSSSTAETCDVCAPKTEETKKKWRYCGTDFDVWPLRSIREDEGVDSTRSAYFLEARSK